MRIPTLIDIPPALLRDESRGLEPHVASWTAGLVEPSADLYFYGTYSGVSRAEVITIRQEPAAIPSNHFKLAILNVKPPDPAHLVPEDLSGLHNCV